MIGAARISKRWVLGDVWSVVHNNGLFGRHDGKVYSIDTSCTFGPEHALAMCALGSVVAMRRTYLVYLDNVNYTDELDMVQTWIDEGVDTFWIAEGGIDETRIV